MSKGNGSTSSNLLGRSSHSVNGWLAAFNEERTPDGIRANFIRVPDIEDLQEICYAAAQYFGPGGFCVQTEYAGEEPVYVGEAHIRTSDRSKSEASAYFRLSCPSVVRERKYDNGWLISDRILVFATDEQIADACFDQDNAVVVGYGLGINYAVEQIDSLIKLGYSPEKAQAIFQAAGPGQIKASLDWINYAFAATSDRTIPTTNVGERIGEAPNKNKTRATIDALDCLLEGARGSRRFGWERMAEALRALGLEPPIANTSRQFFRILAGAHQVLLAGRPIPVSTEEEATAA